jgi:hypothetical protein
MIHKTVRKDETVKDLWEVFTVKLHSGRQKMKQVMRACACAIFVQQPVEESGVSLTG